MRANTSLGSDPSLPYALAACLATSANNKPQAPASFHVVRNVSCCSCPGAAQTRRTSTAFESASAIGGVSRALLFWRLPNIHEFPFMSSIRPQFLSPYFSRFPSMSNSCFWLPKSEAPLPFDGDLAIHELLHGGERQL